MPISLPSARADTSILALSAVCATTTSTSLPKRNFVKPLARKSNSSSKLGLRRGKQHWSALVSAPTSRIARVMRPVLGDALWHSFVAHANAHYKEAFVGAFAGPVLEVSV